MKPPTVPKLLSRAKEPQEPAAGSKPKEPSQPKELAKEPEKPSSDEEAAWRLRWPLHREVPGGHSVQLLMVGLRFGSVSLQP